MRVTIRKQVDVEFEANVTLAELLDEIDNIDDDATGNEKGRAMWRAVQIVERIGASALRRVTPDQRLHVASQLSRALGPINEWCARVTKESRS